MNVLKFLKSNVNLEFALKLSVTKKETCNVYSKLCTPVALDMWVIYALIFNKDIVHTSSAIWV